MAKKLTQAKARKILHDKTVHGKPLTEKQRKFFGAVSSGYIKAQNGIEGTMGGLTDVGFNYNGAWGGTMQEGGYIDSVLNANKNLDWVQRLYEKNTPSIKIPGEKGRSTHFMEYSDNRVYPTVVRMPNGKLKYLADKAYDYADSTKTYIQFPSDEAAKQFSENYKKGTGVLKDFAMGGGIPGAVGFMYARTAGAAPANGPYAKKTKASAQDGKNVEYMELPEITVVGSKDKNTRDFYNNLINTLSKGKNPNNPFVDQNIMEEYLGMMNLGKEYGFPKVKPETRSGIYKTAKGHYNPLTKTIYANTPNTWVAEMAHHVQMKDNIVGKGLQWLGNDLVQYAKQPIVQLKNAFKYGINSSPVDYSQEDFNEWFNTSPYNKKGSVEYEAHSEIEPMLEKKIKQSGEKYKQSRAANARIERFLLETRDLQNGGEMKYYQAGLDFKPKTISQDGSIISPLGQWAYPGEITTVPSNEITMQGVPYPVLGISDMGDTQMMYPGEDYTFDGEYVTEYPMAKGGISVNQADAQPLKKLDQLLNFTNYNDMAKAKKGKKLPKALDGLSELNTQLGSMGGIGGATGQLLGGIQMLIEEGKQKKKTQQMLALSDVSAKAATSRPVGPQRKYVRPEDMLVQPGQIGSPYGVGLDFLQMEDGGPVVAQIGGNPTEIQNMYNPGDLYSDLGYEPLDESSKLKQFRKGGKAQFGMQTTGTTTTAFPFSSLGAGEIGNVLGSYIGGGGGQQSGAGQIGSAVGGIAGNLLLPGVGGAIGSALGGLVGGAIGGQSQKAMEQKQRRAQGNLASAALQQSLQGQFYGYMEHGGDLKYLSHTWQPQTITKFGDYTMKELLAPPKDADMLRAGGEIRDIRSNYMGDDERLSMMQMGGELQTYWGGYAEPISQNPYLPDGGETVMFKGQSHEESDGKGRTGIGITYGNNPVEVERGEPAVKLRDGGTGDNSLVVFGNMKIPSYGVSELNDPKAKGKKFKTYAADLSKIENKANRTSNKATDILENVSGDGPFDLLSMSTANAMLKGSDMKLKDIAMKKQLAAGIQSAILDTAEEMGVESDALAKGKIKAMKGGGKLTSAQVGVNQPLTPIMPMSTYYQVPVRNTDFMPLSTTPEVEAIRKAQPAKVTKPSSKVAKSSATANAVKRDLAKLDYERDLSDPFPSGVLDKDLATTTPAIENLKKFQAKQPPAQDKFNLLDLVNVVSPYIRPLVQNPLDPSQLSPEMMALATNVSEPVQAQLFRPLLEEVPRVSLQDQLNEIQAEANAARRLAGNNPAAQAAIASQAAAAKNKVLGEQTRMNQMLQLESRRRNLATLNDATLKNLAILDQQFVRQAQAQSATKAQAQTALGSIADKIARNKAETLQANVLSNMYPQYRFGPKGRIYNVGLTQFNVPQTVGTTSPTAKNGSIVKAIKNL